MSLEIIPVKIDKEIEQNDDIAELLLSSTSKPEIKDNDILIVTQKLRADIKKKTGKNVVVIISDTFGRPFRMGQTNCAIGLSGISAISNYVGTKDTFGRTLHVTEIAVVDELCSASELVMGKSLN